MGASAASAAWVTGCGAFPAESGPAYAPWDYPRDDEPPEIAAAHAALLSASPHNTQPWALRVTPERIDLLAVPARNVGAMDALRRELHIGLGCALESLVLAAEANGRAAEVALFPDASAPELAARVQLTPARRRRGGLFSALAARHTNRGAYLDGGAPPGLEAALRKLVDDPAVGLTYLDRAADRRRFRESTAAATEAIVADQAMNDASHAWYRHSKAEIDEHRDGLTLDATGLGATLRFLGKTVARPSAAEAGEYWVDAARAHQGTAAAFVLLSTTRRDDRAEQMRVGRVMQRIHLFAVSEGLALQPLNQMPERQDRELTEGLAPRFTSELAALTGSSTSRVQLALRIGIPWDEPLQSPRRPLSWVML